MSKKREGMYKAFKEGVKVALKLMGSSGSNNPADGAEDVQKTMEEYVNSDDG